jgi:AraC family transcriptional regulator, transcriptional activator of pobA
MKHYKSLTQLHLENEWNPPRHPLFSVVGFLSECTLGDREFTSDCYVIAFKKIISGHFMYGRTRYDHENGSMFFTKPRQIIELKDLQFEQDGFMIFIHEDYLKGHDLHHVIEQYGYFDYESNEALHLSPDEVQIMWDLHDKINNEYQNRSDEYSREIILHHLGALLKYAQRYFKRQFIDRQQVSGKTASRFNDILKDYLAQNSVKEHGLPSVQFMADQLYLSPRYLSDLLRQETGKSALELIHLALISEVKNLLRLETKTVSEIAYELGFENSSYLARLFKKQTGMTPVEFRKMKLN